MTLQLLRVVWRLRLRGLEAFLECSRKLWKAACSGELGVQEGLSTAISSVWPPRPPQSFSMSPLHQSQAPLQILSSQGSWDHRRSWIKAPAGFKGSTWGSSGWAGAEPGRGVFPQWVSHTCRRPSPMQSAVTGPRRGCHGALGCPLGVGWGCLSQGLRPFPDPHSPSVHSSCSLVAWGQLPAPTFLACFKAVQKELQNNTP